MALSSFPSPAAAFPIRVGMVIAAAVLPGCAQSKSWMPPMPWQSTASAEERRERYGLTANERVKALEKRVHEARAAGTDAETALTTDLAHSLLAEHDPRVRSEIVRLAAGFDTPSALAICRGALEDPDERVRKSACDAWGGRGGPEAVKLLAHRYETDTDIDVRLRAVRMLGGVKDQAAIPALARALEDSDPAVQYRAVAALRQVSGRDLGDDVNRWRAWAADPGSEPEWSVAETFRKLF